VNCKGQHCPELCKKFPELNPLKPPMQLKPRDGFASLIFLALRRTSSNADRITALPDAIPGFVVKAGEGCNPTMEALNAFVEGL
jgi:hypothetical protein